MMTIRRTLPSPAFREYVRHFELRELMVEGRVGVRPIPARSAQLLVFHLADQAGSQIFDHRSGKTLRTPPAGVMGPQTFRAVDALWKGNFRDFVVSFQPSGFYRLFSLPMTELTDRVCEASELMGREVCWLHERLHQSASLNEMARLTESFFLKRLSAVRPFHAVQVASAGNLDRHGQVQLDDLVQKAGLSQRQFERKFIEQVGMRPKLYCRVSRLNNAIRLKEQRPDQPWTDITYQAGYFDQTHLIKDFKLLAGATPSEFFRLITEGFAASSVGPILFHSGGDFAALCFVH
jgi:AraC-like DNA-binding protein